VRTDVSQLQLSWMRQYTGRRLDDAQIFDSPSALRQPFFSQPAAHFDTQLIAYVESHEDLDRFAGGNFCFGNQERWCSALSPAVLFVPFGL